ncbi:MAG TPA: response regulator transcription factor [Terriglobales bacterium]
MDFRRKARILIADSHKLVADACKQILEPEFDVTGIVSDGRSLVQAALKLKPDVAILETFLPQLNGIDAAKQIKRTIPPVKLVFLTANSDVDTAAEAFRRGACAYVLKQSGVEEFVVAIRIVMRGESYLSPLIDRETLERLLHPPKHQTLGRHLTHREVEVLQLLIEGRSMKQVAAILEIASHTVAFHKYNMMEKLGINTNAGLFHYAMNHYITPRQENWTITDSTGTRLLEAG